MEQSILPSNPAQITKEVVKASYNIEITRLNYQAVLQATEDIVWTRENIHQDLLAPAKFVAAKLTDKKEMDKRPLIDAGKVIQGEYNSVFNPLNDAISRQAEAKKKLADQIQREEDEANAAIARHNAEIKSVSDFITFVTNEITESDTDFKIVLIEKKIGSETQRKNLYGSQLQSLKDQCEGLKPLITKQKEYIRVLAELNKSKESALKKGDEDTAVVMRHKAEDLKEVIDENKLRLQQKAFEQIETSDVMVGIPVDTAPNARRTWWKWRIDDIQLLAKKMPELVELVPNSKKIDEILKQKRDSGEFDGKREEKLFGITFYQDKSYK